MTSSQLACITAPNLVVNSMRISRLTLLIDNSTHQLPYPFTYQPDPIITQIEPAESFVSGGRLILITGQHLASPQTTKLMVYHEFKPSIANTTACVRQNDTLVTCLTPAFSRDLLLGALDSSSGSSNQHQQHSDGASQQEEDDDANYRNTDQQQAAAAATAAASQLSALSHDFGGIKLKMALIMDDVKSVRNLDEYYHHLPHYLTYYEDPRLHRLPNQLIEYRDELQIAGENLMMRQLDQDMLITVGAHVCAIKSILSDRVVCEPPARIAPIYDDKRRLVERPLLAMVALIGSNLRYELGYMQYSSSQYTQAGLDTDSSSSSASYGLGASDALFTTNYNGMLVHTSPVASNAHSAAGSLEQANGQGPSSGYLTMGLLSLLGFVVAFAFTLMFAMARFRRAKAKQREYKRIQLQMGSLDINGQPVQASIGFTSGGLFDKIHLPKGKDNNSAYLIQHQQQLFRNANLSSNGHQQQQHQGAMDFVAGGLAGSKTKPFYQFFTNASHGRKQQQQQARLHGPGSFPPSPLTDISSLVGSSPAHGNNHQPQQHILKLNSNGTVISSSTAFGQQQQQYECGPSQMTGALSSLGGSGSSNSSSSGHLLSSGGHNYAAGQAHQLQQQQLDGDLLQQKRSQMGTTGSRNFNWTQEAPSTIVPYAVIEACNLTLTGKNAIKEYV